MSGRLVAVAWSRFQPRTLALAEELGGEALFISPRRGGAISALPPVRYARAAVSTWRLLERKRPRAVVAISPPVFLPLVAWLWCRARRGRFVVDCHTSAFRSPKWAWTRPLHRWLARRAVALTFHSEEILAQASGWRGRALLLPDDVPAPRCGARTSGRLRLVVAGSLDSREPVAEALAAAALLPEVEWRFTGNADALPGRARSSAPANAVFTGWLDYDDFMTEIVGADVVAAFSSDPEIMNRAAFEAVGVGRPLVLSDLPGLRARFGDAALFCANEPAAMAAAVAAALAAAAELERRSLRLRRRLQAMHEAGLEQLVSVLGNA